jgi:lysozyme
MLFLWGYEWWMSRKAHYTRYDEFGIDIPTNYSVHGIDVSKYQRCDRLGKRKSNEC